MKSYISKSLFIGAVTLALSACSDDNKFEPGPATSPDSPEVVFSADTQAKYLLSTGEAHSVELTLERTLTDNELTVPIIINYAADGLSIPSEVTFEAGAQSASFTISVTDDYKVSQPYKFELALPAEMVNYYSSTISGTATITSQIVIVKPLKTSCYFYYYFNQLGKYFDMDMMITAPNEYYFPDFMGCGYPVTINVDPSTNDITINSEIGEYYPDYEDYGFFVPLYPGGENALTYITDSYVYYPGYSEYFDDSTGRGIMLNMYIYMADGSSDYDYCYIYFPEDDETSEDDQPATEE